jgi:type VI secretion system protein ImpJ
MAVGRFLEHELSWRSKVVWSEGMLLQPQHLQQSERNADHVRHVAMRATVAWAWGFSELEIDTAALELGKLALVRAVGVFGDGTVFDMPAVDPLPEPLELPPRRAMWRSSWRCRCAGRRARPTSRFRAPGAPSRVRGGRARFQHRRRTHGPAAARAPARTAHAGGRRGRCLDHAGRDPRAGAARDNLLVLAREQLPPLLDVAAHPTVHGWVGELRGLIHQRARPWPGA